MVTELCHRARGGGITAAPPFTSRPSSSSRSSSSRLSNALDPKILLWAGTTQNRTNHAPQFAEAKWAPVPPFPVAISVPARKEKERPHNEGDRGSGEEMIKSFSLRPSQSRMRTILFRRGLPRHWG
ncbi:hypothetical protein GYMLUDRAFT_464547 [Collybiopsis luxurians FD-317 M1]|uniref:Uncharacterized protein n=1 Tax=Collybiopsis luxurians FD-317 M1 TaxID=944289 RepID=A0A0D0CK98_9AGAR|nr:hypothetical protein GYMLUDRAFT_464547 [Collybiopsis luxurians FD-317 M1]